MATGSIAVRRNRSIAGLLAILLAVVATIAVFAYVNNVRNEAKTGATDVAVVVAKQDIPVGTRLDSLLSAGAFGTISVASADLVKDAITSLDALKGKTTSAAIVEGEQITSARLEGSTTLAGGSLGIPKGEQAVTVPLDISRVVGGVLQRGDHVTVYATFSQGGQAGTTVTLIPDALVLKAEDSGTTGSSTTTQNVTLALHPTDNQKLIFAQEQGTVWFGLLPPGQKGFHLPPTSMGQVAR